MLGTIILDCFKRADAPEIAKALELLCSPDDHYGWASTGVYSFFDPDTRETLYLGLAQNFTERFKQHTGLAACEPKFCKRERIEAHFSQKEKLGFGVFAQSPLSQPPLRRNKRKRAEFGDDDLAGLLYAKKAEGLLIEAHKLVHGKLPSWNVIGGAKSGQTRASRDHIAIVQALSGHLESPAVARVTLRDLAEDPVWASYEQNLHAARVLAVLGGSLLETLELLLSKQGINEVPQEYIQYLQRAPQL